MRVRTVLGRALMLAAGMAACAAAGPAGVTATEKDNGKTVKVASGAALKVRLKSNATTGYAWAIERVTGSALKSAGAPEYVPPKDAKPGAGGAQVFTFKAVKAGKAKIALKYVRSWEKDQKPAEQFALDVTVR